MNKLLIGIDGTGPLETHAYLKDTAGGFISRMCNSSDGRNACGAFGVTARYFRGPTTLGLESTGIACSVVRSIASSLVPTRQQNLLEKVSARLHPVEMMEERLRNVSQFYQDGIFLAGYSRGCHIAIAVARALNAARVSVKSMFLFDSVDRDIGMNSRYVPGNVESLFHAMRDDGTNSRWYFGHSGREWKRGDDVGKKICFVPSETVWKGSHAALGGLPWEGDKPRQHRISVAATLARSAVKTAGIVSNWDPVTQRTLTSISDGMLNPLTLSEEQDIAASTAVYEWMRKNTNLFGIDWSWDYQLGRAQRRNAGGGGGASW